MSIELHSSASQKTLTDAQDLVGNTGEVIERLKTWDDPGNTHVDFDHKCSDKNQSNHGQKHDSGDDTDRFKHLLKAL